MERHSFLTVLVKSPKNCAFPQNFHTRKLGEITAIYAVSILHVATFLEIKKINLNLRYLLCDF